MLSLPSRPVARSIVAVLLLATALAAQGGGKRPQRPGPDKDDALTRKDPAVVAIDKFLKRNKPSTGRQDWRTALKQPEVAPFAADRDYLWHLATSKGELTVRFLPEAAPMHVSCALFLTRAGFYDGLVFHRIVKGFMAQGGCPRGDGTGNAGWLMEGECKPDVKHDKPGILSTANTGEPKTDGSQFFLTFVPTPHLDGKHTVYGEVTEGLDVLQAIDACGVEDPAGKPAERVEIVRAWITVAKKVAPAPAPAPGDGDGDGDGGKKQGGGDRK